MMKFQEAERQVASITLESDLLEELEKHASRNCRTVSSLIECWVAEELEERSLEAKLHNTREKAPVQKTQEKLAPT